MQPLRRNFVAGLGLTLGLGPGARRVQAQDGPPPITIGVLTDQTGIGAAVSGPPLLQAVRMAVQDTGPLPDGRRIAVITESFQLRPDDALTIARRWFDQDVAAIVDMPGSAAAAAVQGLARSRGRTTLVTGSVNPDLTTRACSPFGSHWAVDSATMTTALVRAMARVGARSWFLVVPDSVLGQSLQADAIRAIEDAGAQLIGRSRHPPDLTDFTSIAAQAKASGAQAVGLCDITRALSDQLHAFQAAGLMTGERATVAFLPAITDIHTAGAAATQGLLLATPFYWTQNDQSRAFAARFLTATGQMPDAAHAAAYVAVRHYLRGIVAAEGVDADRVNQEMRRAPVYFFGRTARLRLDGRLAIDLSLLRVKPPAEMTEAWDHYTPVDTLPAAEIYRPMKQISCQPVL